MSGGSDTEQKNLPPSQHKLRRARERGQVKSGEHLTNAVTFLAGILTLAIIWKSIVRVFDAQLSAGSAPVLSTDGTVLALSMLNSVYSVITHSATIFVVIGVAAILSNIVQKGGLFSTEPVSPKFERVSLASGFKRLIGLKTWAELGIGILHITIWFVIGAAIVHSVYPQAIRSGYCGLTCQFNLSSYYIILLVGIAALVLLAVGVSDLPLQSFLFQHEMRMGKSEAKRDQKESNGDPTMKNARKNLGRSMVESAAAASGGIKSAALVIRGHGIVIALRYDQVKFPVPLVIAKASGENSAQLWRSAEALKVPVVMDSGLAVMLHKEVQLGDAIAKKHFDQVAMALVQSRM